MNIIRLAENIFSLELGYLSVTHKDKILFEYNKGNNPNISHEFNERGFDCRLDFYRDEPLNEKQKTDLKDLIVSFVQDTSLNCFSEMFYCTDILYSVLKHDTIDQIIDNMVKGLLRQNNFHKAGFFFLNESLVTLKGVIYGEVNGEIKTDNFNFRKISIPINNRNHFTDIIFFEKIDTVNTEIFQSADLEKYFDGEVACCGVYSSKGPIGAIIAQSDSYNSHKMNHMGLYGQICSVALELSRTLQRLEFAVQDINYFRENLHAVDNFAQIGRLAATVAHELKNPLVAIGGFSKRLEKIVENTKAKNYLNIIYSEIERLEKIVSDILFYSKEMTPYREHFYLNNIIFEISQLLDDRLRTNNVNIDLCHDSDIMIFADIKRIKQVLINLLSNSIDAMEKGGSIKVYAANAANTTTIEIYDKGGGIPEEVIDKTCEPFFTTKENGTGLGLPLCKRIIKSHGGDMTITNVNEGLKAKISLPFKGESYGTNDIDN